MKKRFPPNLEEFKTAIEKKYNSRDIASNTFKRELKKYMGKRENLNNS